MACNFLFSCIGFACCDDIEADDSCLSPRALLMSVLEEYCAWSDSSCVDTPLGVSASGSTLSFSVGMKISFNKVEASRST